MILNNFILEEYDENNIDHKSLLIKLGNDHQTRKYLGDLELLSSFINSNKDKGLLSNFYIVYFHYTAIGVITINQYEKLYEISYGILPEYRKQNFAVLLLKEFSNKLFEKYSQIEQLDLRINIRNIGSQKVAKLAGYDTTNNSFFIKKR